MAGSTQNSGPAAPQGSQWAITVHVAAAGSSAWCVSCGSKHRKTAGCIIPLPAGECLRAVQKAEQSSAEVNLHSCCLRQAAGLLTIHNPCLGRHMTCPSCCAKWLTAPGCVPHSKHYVTPQPTARTTHTILHLCACPEQRATGFLASEHTLSTRIIHTHIARMPPTLVLAPQAADAAHRACDPSRQQLRRNLRVVASPPGPTQAALHAR